ncbi:cysteine hydrolase family protein [Collimonas pratensis]|uniref:Isochorismatase family protein n=1 Tax=Collimonas pratensis TaxID=279113 RepID=A0A127QBM8_9BURK|nr:cysteine hydrolase family protein [Collimonas pratensis]AMP07424.1 isochorismatase family protein [Collimonas pratensis]
MNASNNSLSRNPTIRSIAGASASTRLDPATTALVVIDIQNEYFTGKLPIPDGLAVVRNANRLIALADKHGMPVFHIQQWSAPTRPLFTQNTVMAEFHPEVRRAAHHATIRKTFASAFASTDLQQQLQARGIKTLILSGLMTNNCISATAFDGVANGYQVIIGSDVSATRDIDAWDGGTVNHKDLHRAVLTGMSDAIAEIRSTSEILELVA